jgi:hypothetical protein
MREKKYMHNRQAAVVRSMDIVCCRSNRKLSEIGVNPLSMNSPYVSAPA